jgi:hypothetical protein
VFQHNSDYSDAFHDPAPPTNLPISANIAPATTHKQPSPTGISESYVDILCKVHLATENWTTNLGPVEDWPRVFREKYDEACCDTTTSTTQVAIDIFLGQVGAHVQMGKRILTSLEECLLARQEGDLLLARDTMTTLHRGIAILEARLEILAPSGPNFSSLQSDIRCHREFEDLV